MDREIPFSFPACAESADDRTWPGNLSNSTNAPSSEDRQYQSNCESAMVSYIALVIIRHVASDEGSGNPSTFWQQKNSL